MSKRAKNDDLSRRGGAPRNGVGLLGFAKTNVMCLVGDLVNDMHTVAEKLRDMRGRRGSRAWRRECWTVAQRAQVRAAARVLRKQARKWVR